MDDVATAIDQLAAERGFSGVVRVDRGADVVCSAAYGLLIGFDAGVSFRSVHDPATALTHTVLANTSNGAWPISYRLDELVMP